MSLNGKAIVTGASGFVGAAVARQLVQEGAAVGTLVRPDSSTRNLRDLNVAVAIGDLRDRQAVRLAFAGARWIFHVAADYRLWAPCPQDIIDSNVLMTRLVMEEALRAGVERVVYTSSVATLACRDGGSRSNETDRIAPNQAIGAYKRSKVLAEMLVESMIVDGLPAVTVQPATPVGPGDVKPTPTGRMIIEAARGRMPAYVNTGLNMVHVDDVAAGHVAALKYGRTGERYILGGQNAAFAEILATIAAVTGRPAPRIEIPRAPLFPVAFLAEAWARRTGRAPLLTLDGLRMAKRHMYFSSDKAERELGYRPRPYAEGIKDAIAWFRAEGRL